MSEVLTTTGARPVSLSVARYVTPVGLLTTFLALLFAIPSNVIVGPLGASAYPAGLVGVAGFLLWAVASMRGLESRRGWRPERIGLIAFWTISLVSYVVLQRRGVLPLEARAADRWLLSLLAWSGVTLVAADLLRTMDEVRRVLRSLMLAASFSATVAILQFFVGFDLAGVLARIPLLQSNGPLISISSRAGFARVAGTAIHPIEFGVVCALAVAIGVHLLMHDHESSHLRRYGTLLLVAVGIPISVSRSAVLATAIVLLALALGATFRQRVNGAIVLVGALVAFHAVTPGLLGTLWAYLFVNSGSTAITARTHDYGMVEDHVVSFPLVGQGGGTYIPHVESQFLDNQYLLTAIELGLAGVVALLLYVLMPVVLGLMIRHRARSVELRHLGITLAGCGLAIVLVFGTFDALVFPMFAGVAALLAGLAGATWRIAREEER